MILDDFLVLNDVGLLCQYGGFYLDPKMPVANAVISHAHADHAVSGNKDVYCTPPTARFMRHRYKRFAAEVFNISGYHESFNVGGVEITFLPAGHMLGSAQVLMIYKGVRYLYTGDFKLEPDATCEPLEFVKADVLITETTFADPETAHPPCEAEIRKLNDTRMNIMLGTYALGKAQRLISLINRHCPDKKILLHHNIMPFASLYQELGMPLGDFAVYDRKSMKNQPEGFIYMVPPMVFNSYIRAINVKRAFVTGWKKLQQGNDLQIYISDHADWNAILKIIEETDPTQVWTLHGEGKHLKAFVEPKRTVKVLN